MSTTPIRSMSVTVILSKLSALNQQNSMSILWQLVRMNRQTLCARHACHYLTKDSRECTHYAAQTHMRHTHYKVVIREDHTLLSSHGIQSAPNTQTLDWFTMSTKTFDPDHSCERGDVLLVTDVLCFTSQIPVEEAMYCSAGRAVLHPSFSHLPWRN